MRRMPPCALIGAAKCTKDGVRLSRSLLIPLRNRNALQVWEGRENGHRLLFNQFYQKLL